MSAAEPPAHLLLAHWHVAAEANSHRRRDESKRDESNDTACPLHPERIVHLDCEQREDDAKDGPHDGVSCQGGGRVQGVGVDEV